MSHAKLINCYGAIGDLKAVVDATLSVINCLETVLGGVDWETTNYYQHLAETYKKLKIQAKNSTLRKFYTIKMNEADQKCTAIRQILGGNK